MEKEINIFAPIILFAYNRPQHTLQTLEALKKNIYADKSLLIAYVDGPKSNASSDDIEKIQNVISVLKSQQWCKEIKIIVRKTNKGLANSITEGVTEILDKYGKAIILEDDIVTDIFFLQFMNQALEKYENETSIACISGYMYPVKANLPETFFLKGADCWGWATWKRVWDFKNVNAQNLLDQLKSEKRTKDFNFQNTYPYVQMLKDRLTGKNNSWAIIWYAQTFLKNQLCLYPGVSLVDNIGNDGSGTHTKATNLWSNKLINKKIYLADINISENTDAKKIVGTYFKTLKPSRKIWIRKLKNKLRAIFG